MLVRYILCVFVSLMLSAGAAALADTMAMTTPPVEEGVEDQPVKPKIYKYVNKDGVVSFSDRVPMRTKYQVVNYSCYACNPASRVDWHSIPLQLKAFDHAITSAARQHGVDPALVRAVIHAESAFKPDAVSRKGARGLMQLMPATAKDMGVSDVMSPAQNIYGGVRYLAWLLDQYGGSTTLATAAYNAGPGAVKRHQGIPPYVETETYVKRVRVLHKRYKDALLAAESTPMASQYTSF